VIWVMDTQQTVGRIQRAIFANARGLNCRRCRSLFWSKYYFENDVGRILERSQVRKGNNA
jgi:hypothetical protein